jgi:hypothetical protein
MLAILDKMTLASINRGLDFIVFLLYTYISILNATYYLATLLPHYMFKSYTAIIRCCLAC